MTGTVVDRDGDLVVTGDGGDCFVVDATPERFATRAGDASLQALKRSGVYLAIGVGATILGLVFLAT